jgi:DNA-binding NtrC family response regulator
VLVVDDCEGVRAAIGLVLRMKAGVRAVGVATSAEALKLARWTRFDLVTTDLCRSGMDGLAFLRAFKTAHPTVPVVVISGILDEANTRRAKRLRAFDCLPKPFTYRELLSVVRAALARGKACPTTVLHSRSRNHRFTL